MTDNRNFDEVLSDVLTEAREVESTEFELRDAFERLDRGKPKKKRAFSFAPRIRLGMTVSATAVMLIACVLAVDIFSEGEPGIGTIIERARAASDPIAGTILDIQGYMTTSNSRSYPGKPARVLWKDNKYATQKEWQYGVPRGRTTAVTVRTQVFGLDGKLHQDYVIDQSKGKYYLPLIGIYASVKGSSLEALGKGSEWEDYTKGEGRGSSEVLDTLSRDEVTFFNNSLRGRSKVKLLGKGVVNGKKVYHLLISIGKKTTTPEGVAMQSRDIVSVDQETYKPVEFKTRTVMTFRHQPYIDTFEESFVINRFERESATGHQIKFVTSLDTKQGARKVPAKDLTNSLFQDQTNLTHLKELYEKANLTPKSKL